MTEAEKSSYLARRNKILIILQWLSGQWELADWLSALIGSNFVTLELIDGIEKILVDAIKSAQDIKVKEKLEEWLSKIQQMKAQEVEERSKEASEVQENLINNFQF